MKREALDHPKLQVLAAKLGGDICDARGIFEGLIGGAARFRQQGDVGAYPDEVIAGWIGSRRWSAGELVGALTDRAVSILEPHDTLRLVVHDWCEHADQSVKRWLSARGLRFWCGCESLRKPGPCGVRLQASSKLARSSSQKSTRARARPEPEPEPEPVCRSPRQPRGKSWRRVPPGELLTEARKSFAIGLGLQNGTAEREWAKMLDHEYPRPRTDVDAAWRNWCRLAIEFRPKRGVEPGAGFVG